MPYLHHSIFEGFSLQKIEVVKNANTSDILSAKTTTQVVVTETCSISKQTKWVTQ